MVITGYTVLFLIAVIWELVWKGFALWKSAAKGQKAWFIAILILNTVGILPIIYLLIERKKEKRSFRPVRFLKAKTSRRKARKGRKRR